MEITDLRETAELARLNMDEEELKKIFPAFEEMLSFFAVMQAADGDGALPAVTSRIEGMAASARVVSSGCLRPDAVTTPEEGLFEAMLSQAPERDGRLIVIPNVL